MKNNIPNLIILSKYRHLSIVSKVFTFTGILLIICFIWLNFRENVNNATQAPESENSGHKSNYEIKILNSTFNGVNENLYPYQINTAQAVKTSDNNYLLDKIIAKYKINKDKELLVNAKNGVLNKKTQILKLKNNVELLLGESILQTPEAHLDLLNKEAFSNAGVILFLKNSQLKANNFSSTNNNTIINFQGRVTTVIDIADF